MKLFAPAEYWLLTDTEKAKLVNGCGPGGWKKKYIPDHILWINIVEACNIHDYMYAVGANEDDRLEADSVFSNNMLRIVESTPQNWFLRRWRRRLVTEYYQQVRDFGSIYFWEGKNPKSTLKDLQ